MSQKYDDDMNNTNESDFDESMDQYDDADQDAFEDEALDTDDSSWNDEGDEAMPADDGAEPQQQKKKSSLLTYAIIGGVLLVGGGIGYMQLMPSSSGDGSAEFAQTEQAAQPTDGALTADSGSALEGLKDIADQEVQAQAPVTSPEQQGSVTSTAPGGFMNEGDLTANAPAPTAAAPALPESGPAMTGLPDTAAPEVQSAEQPQGQGEQPVAATDSAPPVLSGLKPVSDFPSVDQIKKADEVSAETPVAAEQPIAEIPQPAPTAAETPVAQAPVDLQPTPVAQPSVDAETQKKLDEALAKISKLEGELSQVKAAPVATGVPSDESAKVQELEEMVKKLQGKIDDLENQPVVEPVRARVSEPAVARATPVKAKPASQKFTWRLKGAQPDSALLAPVNHSGEIRRVYVGDTVPGLGRILSIDQSATGWVVKGTSGTVRQ